MGQLLLYPPSSVEDVFPAHDVRGELVAVLAAVAADVALERLVEPVAAHVDGKHNVVQEEHAAVLAPERAHGSTFGVDHSEGLPRGGRGYRRRTGRRRQGCREGRVAPVLSLCFPVLRVARTASVTGPAVGDGERRRVMVVSVDEVMAVSGVQVWSQSGAVAQIVGHALSVCGVLATIARGGQVTPTHG